MEEENNPWQKRFERERKAKKESERLLEEKSYELWKINKNLEKQVSERTESLHKALLEAQNANNAKSIFLANMSHEIRTPLNSIIGFSQILSKDTTLSEQNSKFANLVNTSANILLDIINEVLDISKIQSGTFDVSTKSTDLHKTTSHTYELFLQRAKDKDISLIYNIDKEIAQNVMTDPIRIQQVLSNFLSNAIKFTPQYGSIYFNVILLEQNEHRTKVEFTIQDTGIGIPKDKIETIFDPFTQVDNNINKKYEGTGLGLSICKHIIEAMDSKIITSSQEDKGTSFSFTLDLLIDKDNIESKEQEVIDQVNTYGNILVAEDHPINQELIGYYLDSLNVTYEIVNNGQEAVESFIQKNYDLVLMDINMPVLDGIEALKKIRAYEEGKSLQSTPVVALTANAIEGDKERFLEIGMDDYLSKPMEVEKLTKLIEKYLKG